MNNIVFDMGGVLINFDPEHFVDRENLPEGDRALVMAAVFRSPEWPMLDKGTMDEADMLPIALSKLPERLHAVASRLILNWEEPVEPIPGMAALVADCKAAGKKVYLLSNASRRQREYWPLIPGHEYFDGGVVSAFEGLVKPDPAIYQILLKRFGLDPADCLFIDDMQKNVDGARAEGMNAVRFTGDVAALRRVALGGWG